MVAGAPVQPIVLQYLEKIDADTEYILGITKSLMGQLPPGTPAARALELLMQRSRDRHADIFTEWGAKWAECMNMLVKIVRQVKPMDIFLATKRTYGGFAMKRFTDEELDMNLEIIPETEAPAPARSTAAELSLIQELQQLNVFSMPPDLQYQVFKRFGVDYLNESLRSDKEYIDREHFYLLTSGVVPQIKPFDNNPLHYEDHRAFYQSDEYQDWAKGPGSQQVMNPMTGQPITLAQQFEQHIFEHQQAMMQQQMRQAQLTAGQKGTPSAPKGGAGQQLVA